VLSRSSASTVAPLQVSLNLALGRSWYGLASSWVHNIYSTDLSTSSIAIDFLFYITSLFLAIPCSVSFPSFSPSFPSDSIHEFVCCVVWLSGVKLCRVAICRSPQLQTFEFSIETWSLWQHIGLLGLSRFAYVLQKNGYNPCSSPSRVLANPATK
jgi:hypothetical protein